MVAIAGGVERLRPHIKTHKLPEILRLHQALGITKFKCATIGEAETAGPSGAPDVLLAFPPVGPKARRGLPPPRKSFPTELFPPPFRDPGDPGVGRSHRPGA